MKTYYRCKEAKAPEEFKRDKNRADGRYPICKACCRLERARTAEASRQYARRYYAEHAEERRAYARAHAKTEAGRRRNAEYMAARRGELPAEARPALVKHREWWQRYREERREDIRARNARWDADNRAWRSAYALRWQAAFRAEHRDEWLARQRRYRAAWRARNRERYNALSRAYHRRRRAEWPERYAAAKQRRRARLSDAGHFTAIEWSLLKASYAYTCLACGRGEPEIRLTVDHVVPLVQGGSNTIGNIQPLCRSCNSRKHDKTIDYRPH